jgi:hypothetical protein
MALLSTRPAAAQEIWFAPPDDMVRPGQTMALSDDFSGLFAPDAPWQTAASRIKTFSIAATYFAQHASDEQLKAIFTFLAAHHIRLDVTLQALFADHCGRGVEGMVAAQREPGDVARRMKSLGAQVDSFSFDGPFVSGHLSSAPNACKFPVAEVARRLAATVADLRTSYPDAKFIDYESVTDQPLRLWPGTLAEWLDAYKRETGRPLDGFVMDLSWGKPWYGPSRITAKVLRGRKVPVGVFITAAVVPQATDAMWMAQAQRNAANVDAAGISPAFAVLASWTPHPRRMLPESDPLALTWLVNWYQNRRK